MPTCVALIADAPQSGKSTVASFMQDGLVARLSFADPLKAMVEVLLESYGYTYSERQEMLYGSAKEKMTTVGLTTRQLLQTLGTEWGRNTVDKDIWVTALIKQVKYALSEGYDVVVDDARFISELEALEAVSERFIVARVSRFAKDEIVNTHSSEGELADYPVHAEFDNTGSLEDLENEVKLFMLAGMFNRE